MSWSKRLKHPSEVLKKGDVVEAQVLNIDAENQRLSLGLKQLATDVWDEFFGRVQVGDVVEGKVVRLTNFGAFVELADGVEGLIHVSEFDDQHGQEKIDLQVDQTYQMKVIKLSPAERKIGLSIRALRGGDYRTDWEHYARRVVRTRRHAGRSLPSSELVGAGRPQRPAGQPFDVRCYSSSPGGLAGSAGGWGGDMAPPLFGAGQDTAAVGGADQPNGWSNGDRRLAGRRAGC